ncbi:hypothetical protein PoB_000864900 [Plakobranchus ocellatus]|uniref:Uncharacterized protein n=1 Tax=Plakobranchus ocellatus TaxID=259542 RepID=A0AAV3YIQ2_9GAST|nr:hypothetical protein PoB_000864900 [Plakobranchus ocellatus]
MTPHPPAKILTDTIIAGSSCSEFDLYLSGDKDGANGAQVASTARSKTNSPISGLGMPATDQGVSDFQWQYLIEEKDLNPVEWKINCSPKIKGVMSNEKKMKNNTP